MFWPVSKLQFFLSPNMIVCFQKKNVCSVKPQRRRSRDGQNSFLNGNRFFVFKRKKTFHFFVFKRKRVYQFFFQNDFFKRYSFWKFLNDQEKSPFGKKRLKAKRFPKWTLRRENDRFVKKIENDAHEVGRRNSSLFIRVEFVLFRFYA